MVGGCHGAKAVVRGAVGAPPDAPPHPSGLLPTQRYGSALTSLFCIFIFGSVIFCCHCFRDNSSVLLLRLHGSKDNGSVVLLCCHGSRYDGSVVLLCWFQG